MARLLAILLFVLCTLAGAGTASAQERRDTVTVDSVRTHLLVLQDGSRMLGRLVRETPDSVSFVSNGVSFTVPRSQVTAVRSIDAIRKGQYVFPDPNRTRLFFAPTARMLAKGEGYFSDSDLLFVNLAGGVTSSFTMGGGMTLIPSTNPQNNLFFITPKIGLVQRPNFALAAGALVGFAGFEGIDAKDRSLGILYGVASAGSNDDHVDFGAGWGYAGGRISGTPALMLGGAKRVSDRVSLVTENYAVPSVSDDIGLMYGMRFMGEKLSVDLAFMNAVGPDVTPLFPGIPYLAFAVKF